MTPRRKLTREERKARTIELVDQWIAQAKDLAKMARQPIPTHEPQERIAHD